MLQFDQFLYSCIFHLPAFFRQCHGNIFICIHQVYIFLHYHYWRRYLGISANFFFRFTYVTSVSTLWRKSTPITSASMTGGLLLMCSMLTLQNWTEICQLLLSGPSPKYQIFHWLKRFHLFCLDNEKLCCKFLFVHWLWNLKQTCSIIVHNSLFLSICLVNWIHWFLVSSLNLFLLRDGLMVYW